MPALVLGFLSVNNKKKYKKNRNIQLGVPALVLGLLGVIVSDGSKYFFSPPFWGFKTGGKLFTVGV